MLNKISGLARALYIVLAIIAGFVALGRMNVALVLVVLGLIAGISMPKERMVLAGRDGHRVADRRRRARPHSGDWRTAQRRVRQSPDGRRRRGRQRARDLPLELVMEGVTGLTGSDAPADSRRGRTIGFNQFPGSAAHRGGALFARSGKRGFDQAAGPRRLDRGAEPLLHQRHHPAHVLHRGSAGLGDDRADRGLGFVIAHLPRAGSAR